MERHGITGPETSGFENICQSTTRNPPFTTTQRVPPGFGCGRMLVSTRSRPLREMPAAASGYAR
jgi:hypothetical protein